MEAGCVDAVGPVCWNDMDKLMHSRLEHVGEAEFGEVSEVAGVAELAGLMLEISRQKYPEQVSEDEAATLELPEVTGRLLGLEVGSEGTNSYIASAGSPPQASLGSPVHGTKHWLVGKGDGLGT